MKVHQSIPLLFNNIAVVIAAFLGGMYFTTFFHEPTSLIGGLWAVISAIVVLETTHAKTFDAAKKRIIGSLIGAVLSGFYLYFFPFTMLGLTATIAIGVILCFVLRLQEAIKLTGVTIAVVVIVATLEHQLHPFMNAGLRFAECAIGTVAAVMVSLISDSVTNSRVFNK